MVEGNLERGKRRSEAPYGVSLPVQDQIDSLQMERVAFMAHGRFSNQQYDTVRSAARDAARIRERADKLARGIKEVFDGDYPKEEWGVTFEPSPEGLISIDTPYGKGRCQLMISVATEASVGRYIVEKQVRSPLDQIMWVPVWSFRIDSNGVFPGEDTTQPFPLMGLHAQGYAEIALSILYAIARGPGS